VEQQYNGCEMAQNDKYSCRNRNFGKRTRQWRRLFCPCFNWIRRTTLGPICQRRNSGITRGTTNAHIARATLEGIAYQVYDLAKSMEADFGEKGKELKVDGGAAK
jgi:sugar (pentulose or hexulose) kinase